MYFSGYKNFFTLFCFVFRSICLPPMSINNFLPLNKITQIDVKGIEMGEVKKSIAKVKKDYENIKSYEPLDKAAVHKYYSKVTVVKQIPPYLYCYKCNKTTKVKSNTLFTRVMNRIKMKSTKQTSRKYYCGGCSYPFNIVKVKIIGPSRLEKMKFVVKKMMRKIFTTKTKMK